MGRVERERGLPHRAALRAIPEERSDGSEQRVGIPDAPRCAGPS